LTDIKYYCNSAEDVPGWTDPLQHEHYCKIVEQLPENPVFLEIGCGWGKSTWAWMDVLPPEAELYIVDLFWEDWSTMLPKNKNALLVKDSEKCLAYMDQENAKGKNQRDFFEEFISQHKNHHILKHIYEGDFSDLKWELDKLKPRINGVYLDGGHLYDQVYGQLEYFLDVPVLCGDDIYHDSVRHALWDWAKQYRRAPKIIPSVNFFVANYIS